MPLPPYVARAADALGPRALPDGLCRQCRRRRRADRRPALRPASARRRSTRRGIAVERLTLHVGAGTFKPMRADDVEDHRMHAERIRVPAATVAAIGAAGARGGRVVAVGTTVVRALEAAAASGRSRRSDGETDIFIRPGHRFRVVDALLTNFHLPESTLLVLVVRLRRARARARRLSSRDRRALPVLQLRGLRCSSRRIPRRSLRAGHRA